MTIHITALGVLLAFCWVEAIAHLALALVAGVERKTWTCLARLAAALLIGVCLVLR